MKALTVWIGVYVLNAAWQLPLVLVAAMCVSRLAKRWGTAVQHRVWVGALLTGTALPGVSISAGDVRGFMQWALQGWWMHTENRSAHVSVVTGSGYAHGGWGLPTKVLEGMAALYLISVLFFAFKLLWGLQRTYRLRAHSCPLVLPADAARRWENLGKRFDVSDAALAVSSEVRGPVTLGVRNRSILVAEGWLESLAAEDFEAAVAHELAHIRRWDFAKNLFYQVVSVPLAFHPVTHWMTARIAETREMVCDEEAAKVFAGPQRYASSLLRLAASFVSEGQTSTLHAIGIFDANTLERRLMNLKTRRSKLRLMQRLGIGVASAGIAVASCASAVALRMNVSSPQEQTAAAPQPGAARVSGEVISGNLLSKVDPVYPDIARAAKVTGSVVLAAVIGTDGRIQRLQVLSGSPMLQNAAMEAVRQWTYRPYLLNGQPMQVQTTITVNFLMGE